MMPTQLYRVDNANMLNVRAFPYLKVIPPRTGILRRGDYVIEYGRVGEWVCIARTGQRWVNRHYLTPVTETLWGLHGRSGTNTTARDVEVMQKVKAQGIKFISAEDVENFYARIAPLGNPFLICRIYIEANRPLTADQYLTDATDIAARWYDRGVRFFELFNEPNLVMEGWRHNWNNGAEFSDYYRKVATGLRRVLPHAYIGYPAMSPHWTPDPNRYDDWRFFNESLPAAMTADFMCLHAYWTDATGLERAIQYVRNFPRLGLPVFVTEFGKPIPDGEQRGRDYLRFKVLSQAEGVFPFLISSPTFPGWAFVKEDGTLDPLVAALD